MGEIDQNKIQEQVVKEQTPDQKGTQDLLVKVVKTLGESSLRSKDYYKFIIGLATGTLIFSLTFTKELIPSPEYKFLLVIGWISLLICVLSGVFLYSKYDDLSQSISSMESILLPHSINPIVIAANRKELEEFGLRILVKSLLDSWIQTASMDADKEKELKELRKLREKVDYLKKGTLKEFTDEMQALQIRLIKDANAKKVIEQLFREQRKLISFFSRFEEMFYLSRPFKSIRVNLLKILYGEKVMRYSFFVGITLISLFSIVNFI